MASSGVVRGYCRNCSYCATNSLYVACVTLPDLAKAALMRVTTLLRKATAGREGCPGTLGSASASVLLQRVSRPLSMTRKSASSIYQVPGLQSEGSSKATTRFTLGTSFVLSFEPKVLMKRRLVFEPAEAL